LQRPKARSRNIVLSAGRKDKKRRKKGRIIRLHNPSLTTEQKDTRRKKRREGKVVVRRE